MEGVRCALEGSQDRSPSLGNSRCTLALLSTQHPRLSRSLPVLSLSIPSIRPSSLPPSPSPLPSSLRARSARTVTAHAVNNARIRRIRKVRTRPTNFSSLHTLAHASRAPSPLRAVNNSRIQQSTAIRGHLPPNLSVHRLPLPSRRSSHVGIRTSRQPPRPALGRLRRTPCNPLDGADLNGTVSVVCRPTYSPARLTDPDFVMHERRPPPRRLLLHASDCVRRGGRRGRGRPPRPRRPRP